MTVVVAVGLGVLYLPKIAGSGAFLVLLAFLELFVKVQEEWRASRNFVEDLDWRRQLEQIAEKQQRDNSLADQRTREAENAK